MQCIELKKEMGVRLQLLREHAGLRQADIAEKLNICSQMVSQWEKGYRSVPVRHLIELPEILDCRLDDLSPKNLLVLYN